MTAQRAYLEYPDSLGEAGEVLAVTDAESVLCEPGKALPSPAPTGRATGYRPL